jgi:hypothetical protein
MSHNALLLSPVLLTLLAGWTAAAPPLPLDLIPRDACIGISVRDLVDLTARAKKIAPLDQDVPAELAKELKLTWKLDAKRPLAAICATGKLAGSPPGADPITEYSLGLSLPWAGRAEVLKAWKLKAEDLKTTGPLTVPGATISLPLLFGGTRDIPLDKALFREDRVFLTSKPGTVPNWLTARPLRDGMAPERQKRLDAADGLFYIGPQLWRLIRNAIATDWAPEDYSEQEAEAFRRTQRAWREVESFLAAVRLDDGLGVDIMTGFDPQGKESQALLKAFNAGGRTSDLKGLPERPPISAFSTVGVDESSLNVARILATQIWFGPGADAPLLASDAVQLRRIVSTLYARLRLARAAFYPAREKAQGQIALVAILDPKDAAAFLKEVAQMARVVDDREFDPAGNAGKAEIAKLVADLGSDDFDVREAASTKLGLIGAPALEALKVAEKSTDAEVRRRASELRAQIEKIAELRKKELAGGLLRQAFHPSFTWKANAEQLAGVPISFLGLRFDAEDAPYAGWLKDFFGPDWHRVRIGEVGGKVVALVGSDVSLLEQAIQNVRAGKPGLEAAPALASFHKNAGPDRRAELHLAVQRIQALTVPAKQLPADFKPTDEISSIGLRTAPAELGLDLWCPAGSVVTVLPWLRF